MSRDILHLDAAVCELIAKHDSIADRISYLESRLERLLTAVEKEPISLGQLSEALDKIDAAQARHDALVELYEVVKNFVDDDYGASMKWADIVYALSTACDRIDATEGEP